VNSRGKTSRPSVPCPSEQDLARRTSGRSTCSFKRRCPEEPSDYQRSPGTATNQNPECQSSRPVEAFKRRRPGEAQRFSKSRNGYRPRPQGAETTIHRARYGAEQGTSAVTSVDINNSHVTIAAENSLRSAGSSRTSSNRVRLGWNVRLR